VKHLKKTILVFAATVTLTIGVAGCSAMKDNYNKKCCLLNYSEQQHLLTSGFDDSSQPGIYEQEKNYSEALKKDCRTEDATFPQNFEGLGLFW
jgi:hypothetical protein